MHCKKKFFWTGLFFLVLLVVFFLGPTQPSPQLKDTFRPLKANITTIGQYIHSREEQLPVKSGNESKFFWADEGKLVQTDYCLLYLHGFSASPFEGSPTDLDFARHFHMNAYIPRLACHGLKSANPMLHFSGDTLWQSAREALQIARLMGKKIIIMSTSTGGTLSLLLAARYPKMVDGLILLSPNIKIKNPASFILAWPWGLQIARLLFHGKFRIIKDDSLHISSRYWYNKYRLESTVALQKLLNASMKKTTFEKVKQPVFMGYYYKDEQHNDPTVSVPALLKMYDQLGTLPARKQKQAFNAGVHVIGCGAFSKCQPEVEKACIDFGNKILKLKTGLAPNVSAKKQKTTGKEKFPRPAAFKNTLKVIKQASLR